MTVSRQRRWQQRVRAEGRCTECGQPRGDDGTNQHCRPCANKKNIDVRNRRIRNKMRAFQQEQDSGSA
jgi:hypothetical protein